eukprot:5445434-Heterocapsa_arctica.AAC.1
MAVRMSDSAPGPDGLIYGAWVKAGPKIIDYIYDAYCHLLNFGHMPAKFNASRMVFIPKGEKIGDPEG